MGLFFLLFSFTLSISLLGHRRQDTRPPAAPNRNSRWITPAIPDSFLNGSAPRLRLPFIPFPGLVPQLLLSATGLFLLHLRGIPHSAGYITVRLLASLR
jgi:hypothetical protein